MLSFHPPAPANWSSPHPSLNRATLDPPLVPFDDSTPRRVIKPPPDLPRPWIQIAEIQSHEGEYPPGSGFCRREECAEKGLHCRSLSTSEGGRGRERQMVVHARPGDGATVIVIRWKIVALSRYVWHPMDDRFRVTSIYSARLADSRRDEDGIVSFGSWDGKVATKNREIFSSSK